MAENQQSRGRAHSRCGNGGPGKSWKCPNPTFPRFPPPLEIPHQLRDSHIPTAPATADRFHTQERNPPKSRGSTDSRSEPIKARFLFDFENGKYCTGMRAAPQLV